MKYEHTIHGRFLDRPNRFIAHVEINGVTETVHVKNTGRCRELLLPDADVVLAISDNPTRKTKYDLVSVYKKGIGWINIDSQAPNQVAGEWFRKRDYDLVRPEYTIGKSRIDFYMERMDDRYLCEIKGCTLEIGGVGYFPDAPTERGTKHLKELMQCLDLGYHCAIAFVIAMPGIGQVLPNEATDPAFAAALREACDRGVEVRYLLCAVTEDSLEVVQELRADFCRKSSFLQDDML